MAETEMGALEAAEAIAAGRLTSEALVRACLARIAARESQVAAWTHIDAERAIAEARARDQEKPRSALHGVPVGVKDIIDTHDMPTTCGSLAYGGVRPAHDAGCVALLRDAGMVVLGKTVTTEFAMIQAGKTRNPHNPAYSPGGSSSGSAAAVGDGQVPLAIGTQTGGSIVRPSAYCGAVGYKPSFGSITRAGVKLVSDSLDTLGPIGRSVGDVAAFQAVMEGRPIEAMAALRRPPRLAFCKSPAWPEAQPETAALMAEAVRRLKAAGAEMGEVELPAVFDEAPVAQTIIMTYECSRALAFERTRRLDLLGPKTRTYLSEGLSYSAERYRWAKGIQAACQAAMGKAFERTEALITPSAPGEPPKDPTNTGAAVFNRIWTMVGVPCVTVPGLKGPNGLPIGTQIVGNLGDDGATLAIADWVHRAIIKQG
jgi:Asp-tRNA(Asn)/Glu-tRNA(Gln) amidotransferase A subunit family amidase